MYDFYSGKIQRISRALGDILSSPDGIPENAAPSELIDKLVSRGFLTSHRGNSPESYLFEHTAPRLPPLRTISFSVGQGCDVEYLRRAKKLIIEAIENFSLGSFAFLIHKDFTSVRNLTETANGILSECKFTLCEFWCHDPASEALIKSSKKLMKHAGRILFSEVINTSDALPGVSKDGRRLLRDWNSGQSLTALNCRPDFYHLIKVCSESYGCLHFNEQWIVFPDVTEEFYDAGVATATDGIESIMNRKRINKYWNHGKDKREKCRDCELRYACPNPLSKRMERSNLSSAPSNCSYDLRRGA